MSHTITIRLTPEQARWLAETSRKTGLAQGKIVRDQIDRAQALEEGTFMRWAGAVSGPRSLSSRKGFSRS